MKAAHPVDIGLLILLLPLVGRVIWDRYVITVLKKPVNHVLHTWVTGILMWMCSCIHVAAIFPRNYSLLFIVENFFLSWGIFVLFFDYLLNWSRGLALDYESAAANAANFDKEFRQFPWYAVLFFKLVFFAISVSVYFYWDYITGIKQFQ